MRYVVQFEDGRVLIDRGVFYPHWFEQIADNSPYSEEYKNMIKKSIESAFTSNLQEARIFDTISGANLAAKRGRTPFNILPITLTLNP